MTKLLIQDGKNRYYEQVGPGNTSIVKLYNISGREITKNGYVYIYVSNETPNVNVYWDNLQITHIRGALLQEEGYYPFGLEMKALCSQAATVTANNYKFNGGTELENSFDVSYYETYFRNYDAQVGRFTGVDPYSESYANMSPYHFAMNNPVSYNDPTGATAYDPNNQHTGITFTGGEYHFERSLWNDDWFEDYGVSMFGGGGSVGNTHYTTNDIINILEGNLNGGTWSSYRGFVTFNSWNAANEWGAAYKLKWNMPDYDGGFHYGNNKNGEYGMWLNMTGSRESSPGFLKEVIFWQEFVNLEYNDNNQKAWYGNFVGPGPDQNPYKIIGPDGNYLKPINMIDAAAQRHDYVYWRAKTGGIKGALFNKTVWKGDLALARHAELVILFKIAGINDFITGEPISPAELRWAIAISIAFTDLGTLKNF